MSTKGLMSAKWEAGDCVCVRRLRGQFHEEHCPLYVSHDTYCPYCGVTYGDHKNRCRHTEFLNGRVWRCLSLGKEGSVPLLCDEHAEARTKRHTPTAAAH